MNKFDKYYYWESYKHNNASTTDSPEISPMPIRYKQEYFANHFYDSEIISKLKGERFEMRSPKPRSEPYRRIANINIDSFAEKVIDNIIKTEKSEDQTEFMFDPTNLMD